MKSNEWDKILEQQIMSSKMKFSINPQSSKGLSSVADQITSQSYTYNSPEAKWLKLDKSKINNSVDSKIMSLAKQLKVYENSGHISVLYQLKALAAQALHEAGYPNDYTIDDYMRANGMLPPLQEDPEMIRQLQRQIIEMQEASRQRDVLLEQINQNNLQLIQGLTEAERIINEKDEVIADRDNIIVERDNIIVERDNTIELQANQLQESQNTITERNNTILQLRDEKHDLTEQVGFLTEEKVDLNQKLQNEKILNLQITEKIELSESKVVPLQEKVVGLEHFNKSLQDDKKILEKYNDDLKNDKIELLQDKKMMIEYNKSLQQEKKLLLEEKNLFIVDKKGWQDLISIRENELIDLKHIHFDTEHCTIAGHCNNPDHD